MKAVRIILPVLLGAGVAAPAQTNDYSLRFHGAGYDQRDRVVFVIDDDQGAPAPDASAPADIGAGSFTIEFWVKGTLADNASASRPAGSYADFNWIEGNVVIDRDIWSGDAEARRKFGVSLGGGRVEFGTGGAGGDSDDTLVGSVDVLDGTWRHVAVTRDASTGVKTIMVDGVVDISGPAGTSTADLSYPDEGVPGQVAPCGRGPFGPTLMIGAEKHDADEHLEGSCGSPPLNPAYPSFSGHVDEVRLWGAALSPAQVQGLHNVIIDPADHPTLVAYWRFEEGSGTVIGDTVPGGTTGELRGGVPGEGEWSADAAPVFGAASVGAWMDLHRH